MVLEMISSSISIALRPTSCNLTSWRRSSKLLTSYFSAIEDGHQYHSLGLNRSTVPLTSLSCLRPTDFNKVLIKSYASKPKDEKKKSKGKIFLAVVGFGVGALAGLGYMYRKMNHKVMPIANLDGNGNAFLFSEPPPIDLIARRVIYMFHCFLVFHFMVCSQHSCSFILVLNFFSFFFLDFTHVYLSKKLNLFFSNCIWFFNTLLFNFLGRKSWWW